MSKISINSKSPQELLLGLPIGKQAESLSEATSVTRLYPSVMVDRSLLNSLDRGVMTNLMQTCVALYVTQYMQAFELSKNKGGIVAREILAPLHDEPSFNMDIGWSGESLEQGEFPSFKNLSGEAASSYDKDITRPSNLAVGKTFDVSIPTGEKQCTVIPITVTVSPREADIDFMVDVLTTLNESRDTISRWHKVWAGEIHWFNDFLLNRDILKKERRLALLDTEDGFYADLQARRGKAVASKIFGANDHINIASNFVVFSTMGAARMANAAGVKDLKNARGREKIFRETGTMCIMVVDAIDERFSVYMRGIRKGSVYTFQDIKDYSTKTNGVDIDALMKAFQAGGL